MFSNTEFKTNTGRHSGHISFDQRKAVDGEKPAPVAVRAFGVRRRNAVNLARHPDPDPHGFI